MHKSFVKNYHIKLELLGIWPVLRTDHVHCFVLYCVYNQLWSSFNQKYRSFQSVQWAMYLLIFPLPSSVRNSMICLVPPLLKCVYEIFWDQKRLPEQWTWSDLLLNRQCVYMLNGAQWLNAHRCIVFFCAYLMLSFPPRCPNPCICLNTNS